MKKKHLTKYGKHPFIIMNGRILNEIKTIVESIDKRNRLIMTRFGKFKRSERFHKMKLNPNNPKEVFIELAEKKWFQRMKIECRDETKADLVYKQLLVSLDDIKLEN